MMCYAVAKGRLVEERKDCWRAELSVGQALSLRGTPSPASAFPITHEAVR